MTDPSADLAFRARALAQAHPLTATARRLIEELVAAEQADHAAEGVGQWARSAMVGGYCLAVVGDDGGAPPVRADGDVDLGAEADRIAVALRSGRPAGATDPLTVQALDRIIASEIDRRVDEWRDRVDDEAWQQLEQYVTYWVVKGYAIRVAETSQLAGP